jgi:hypothetical protein
MRSRTILAVALALAAAAFAATSAPHVRLIHSGNGNPLFWENPDTVGIVVSSIGSADIPDESETAAMRHAIDAWNDVTGTTARLVENASPAERARTDWDSDSIHLMLFDETNTSGFFPVGSATVAITPIQYLMSGKIADADVLFNGRTFTWTTAGAAGSFDVADVATHELGHLLGLDHTGHAGASLYPYVSPNQLLHRSPSADDENGIQHAYPSGSHATITGTVRRQANQSVVPGAHVVARDANGRPAAAALASNTGAFALRGLASGTYTIYACPLDFPVSEANLANGHLVETDFESTIGTQVVATAGSSVAYGDLLVDPDVTLSLGRNSDPLPLLVRSGATVSRSLHGAGFDGTCSLAASDPTITISNVTWNGSTQVFFDVNVPGGSAAGHVDLAVTNAAGDLSILTGALEVVPPSPTVATVVPPAGTPAGGTLVTITGSGFGAGARVAIGPRVYDDGEPGGCTVVNATTIQLTTASTAASVCDVVVIDSSGVEGRLANAFEFVIGPTADVVFPPAGSDNGGTQVVVTGSNFADPMLVRIGGVAQGGVTVESPTRLRFTTSAGAAGAATLEVEDSFGEIGSSTFTYVSQPDPAPAQISPASGSKGGGTNATITGAGFTASAAVVFGANRNTGLGGTPAASVTFVDAQTLQVVTPAHSSGNFSVLVRDTVTGQAALLATGFTFQSSGGGGGGGCSTTPVRGPEDWRSVASGAGWIPLLLLLLLLARRRAERGAASA